MYKFLFKLTFCFIIIFSFNSLALAETQIYSFTTTNQSALSGQLVAVNWSGNETSGYNLSVSCADGVKIKNENGSLFSCDTKVSTSGQDSDSMNFYVVNVSGTSKSVTFKLYPKNQSGTELPDLVRTQTMTISPATQPISSASASATTTVSGMPITISWSSADLDGVNIMFDCVDGLSFSSLADSTKLTCGSLAFSDKLSGSGSANIYFKNKNSNSTEISLRVIPYIGNGTYDLTHAATVTFNVATDKSLPTQILSFSSSRQEITSGDTVSLSWVTQSSPGVNFKVDCVSNVSFYLATTSNVTNKCDTFMSNGYFGPNAGTDITFFNSSNEPRTTYVTLYSQLQGGGFDGVNIKKVPIQVNPLGWKSATVDTRNTTVFQPIQNTTYSQTPSQQNTTKVVKARKKFLKLLALGSKGDDVSALQEFLKNNGYYTEGLVTGYMGPATVRAIKRFQEQNGVAKQGQAGYGSFGPATRAKINSL